MGVDWSSRCLLTTWKPRVAHSLCPWGHVCVGGGAAGTGGRCLFALLAPPLPLPPPPSQSVHTRDSQPKSAWWQRCGRETATNRHLPAANQKVP